MSVFPSIQISLSASPLLAILLIAAAAVLAWAAYRVTLPPVSRARRIALGALRGAAFALILLLLLEPVLRSVTLLRHPPVLAVLADRSGSMMITDASGRRADQEDRLIGSVLPGVIPAGAETELYAFGASLRGPLRQIPDTPGDDVTDIAGALRALAHERERRNIRAAIMLTDGMVTRGENPVLSAAALGIPVFTIGIGDTAEQKDVLISRVTANDIVYAGTTAPVDVLIKSSGYGGVRCEVTLEEGSRTLDRTVVMLPPGTAEVPAHLSYTPEGEGTRRYTVRVSSLPGELTAGNNRRLFTVRVLRSGVRVLLLASGPSPDLAMIRGTLREDPNVALRVLAQKSGGGYYEGTLAQNTLDSTDCVMTIGVPDRETPAAAAALLRSAVTDRKMPVFVLGGPSLDPSRLFSMVPSLPVAPESVLPGEQETEFAPDPSRMDHPLLALGSLAGRDVWSRLPPVFSPRTVYRLREGSLLLGSPRLRNVALPRPLMALRDIAGTRSLCFMAYGVWRWRLMAQGDPETASLLASFLSSAVRWLSSREEGRSVRVAPERDQFASGEPVAFSAQVYDESAQPVEDARVSLEIRGKDTRFEAELRPLGNGRYEGALEGVPPGEFTFRASAARGGHALGGDAGSFLVGGLNLEYLDTRMDADLLRQIAYRTGGAYLPSGRAQELGEALRRLRTLAIREERRGESFELHRAPYVLGLVILLFSAEWILRRRSGML